MGQNNCVVFNSILVNSINTNAGIFVGTNGQNNWNSNSNSKSGFGSVLGAGNVISRAVNIFTDNDFIDTPIINSGYNGARLPVRGSSKNPIEIYGCRRCKKQHPE